MIWNGCQKIRSKKPDTERDCPASFTRCARRRTLQMDINFWENVLFLTAIFPDHFQKIPRMLRQIPVFPIGGDGSCESRFMADGGCTDSVPVEAFRRLGYKRNVVVLTRDSEYRKKPENTWMADIVYHKYPKFAEALKNRAVEYNMSIRNIEKLERAGEVFVIRPSVPLTIPRICKSAEEIEKTYQIGVMDAKKMMADLRKWLETSDGSEG